MDLSIFDNQQEEMRSFKKEVDRVKEFGQRLKIAADFIEKRAKGFAEADKKSVNKHRRVGD